MNVFRGIETVPADLGPSAVTIGKFDGVHAGHRSVIQHLREVAAADSLSSVAVTFDRNPLEVINPALCPANLVSVDQKIELLAETGIDAAVLLTFDRALSELGHVEFVDQILVDALQARVVLVGEDFRFGRKGTGNVEILRQLGAERGFTVVIIDEVRPTGDRRVSSTWIRELLRDGDVAAATELLGHVPQIRGVVVHGAKRGRELGFPTANLSPASEGLIPADGVYAGWLTDGDNRYPAAISVGSNPTFEGVPPKQVEAYVLDEDLDLYDHTVDVEFVERIRGMVKYTGVEPLIAQMADDVSRVRPLLGIG